jgi:membrane-bound lytic murein transglycosylase D
MVRSHWQRRFLIALLPFVAACGSSGRTKSIAVTPAAVPVQHKAQAAPPQLQPLPIEDPVLTLIATSDRHFKAGQKELEQGHFEAAKQEFNRAVDVLLESPYGARTEPRIREHFDRLVDRISTYEVKALATGDGFTEKKYESASIDELLALSTSIGTPNAPAELKDAVASDLLSVKHDIPIPLNQRVLSYIDLFQGRLHDFIEEGMKRGSKYLPMIQNVFRAEGLPLDLAYVPLVESAFKPNALSREGEGRLAVHGRHCGRKRVAARLVHRRAFRSGKGHGRRGQVPEDAVEDLRRRLAPRAGLLQRRPRPPAARDEPDAD